MVLATCAALRATLANDASEKEWMRQYVRERAASHCDHSALREALGRRPDDDGMLRSIRGRLDVRCEDCGAIGQYKSSCDVCRAKRQEKELPTVQNDTSYHYWGQQPRTTANSDKVENQQRDVNRKEDKGYLPSVKMSFSAGPAAATAVRGGRPPPYQARSHGEANLHIVLHFATRCLRQYMSTRTTFAETVLREPIGVAVAPRENPIVFEEDRDELLRKQPGSSFARTPKAHEYLGHMRIPHGDVDDSNDLWKRGPAFCFDRSQSTGAARDAQLLRNYAADPAAGRRNAHGYKKWLDPTSVNDHHATSGRECTEKLKVVEARLRQQSAWAIRQQRHEANKGEIYDHVADLLSRELKAEAERQTKRMPHDFKQARAERAKLEQARCEAADRIIRILVGHDIIKSIEEADYLIYANDISLRGMRKKKGGDAKGRRRSIAGLLGASTVDKMAASASEDATFSSGATHLDDDEGSGSNLSSIVARETLDDLRLYETTRRSGDFGHEAKASQLERLAMSGPGRLRKGRYSDDSMITPAVVPFPDALSSGGLSPLSSRPAGNFEKSAAAAAVLDAVRAQHKEKCRGDEKKKRQMPFWCRMTDAGPGQRHYSAIFGQPMAKFSR